MQRAIWDWLTPELRIIADPFPEINFSASLKPWVQAFVGSVKRANQSRKGQDKAVSLLPFFDLFWHQQDLSTTVNQSTLTLTAWMINTNYARSSKLALQAASLHACPGIARTSQELPVMRIKLFIHFFGPDLIPVIFQERLLTDQSTGLRWYDHV